MREFLIIVEREFRERVQTRSFVIGTLVFPVFMVGILLLPTLMGDTGRRQLDLAVVDRAPAGVGDVFVAALVAGGLPDQGTESGEAVPPPYRVEHLRAAVATEELNRRVLAGTLDGYVILSDDLLEAGTVVYRARNIANHLVLRDIRLAATAAVQDSRLEAAGLDAGFVQRLLHPVELNAARITAGGEEGGDAQGTFLVAYLLAFLAYVVIAMYGHAVMRSVLQEKVTRISEILVSTVRATQLMAGKIGGVSGAALLQVAIWAAMVVVVLSRSDLLQDRLGVPASMMDAFRLDAGIGIVLVLFFVLGFLLFAALFAALGAAMSTEQEAQPFQMVLMLPLFVPLIFLGPITSDPDSRLAVFLGLFPLTAPVAMPMRLAAAPADATMVAVSLTLLALSTAALAWLAGKIYRVGILATGKRPTVNELVRWIRSA
jgi:ABC-2 type transport system permease protein